MATMNGQEDTLLELMAKKQWKQAFNLCEKRLKKAPGSDYLIVTKIKILLHWPDYTRYQQGNKELHSLLERKPPVADIEALRALDTVFAAFESVGQFTPIQKQTWHRAALSRPQDENLHSIWYKSKFNEGDFKGAQQASMTWMKNFPKERKPFFLYILNTHLLSEQTIDEQEKSLMQRLAFKYLSKAASYIVESDEEASTDGRQIQSFEDRRLLLRVYQAQGKFLEAIEILEHPRLGLAPFLGGQRWELTRQYMDLLELCERWTQLRETCDLILEQSRDPDCSERPYGFGKLGDDWKTWQMLIRAENKDNPAKNSSRAEETIRSYCNHSTTERNARLALLYFYSVEVFEGRKSPNVLLKALTDHFRDFSKKVVCFLDCKPWLSNLDIVGQDQLLLEAAQCAQDSKPQKGNLESSIIFWITREINLLKLEYYLVISRDWNSHRADLLAAFVSNCLRLYKTSLEDGVELPVSDRRPGDDAALLAAMGLIRLFKMGKRQALLQSVVILEHTLLRSKHNYDALLILVRLYLFIGAGSLAMDRYNRLSIKNIQHATISWVLYTRLSSIHPYSVTHSSGGKGHTSITPIEGMASALHWHNSAEELSRKAVHSMQENGQWELSLESLETNRAVFDGFARCLLYAELKRVERFSSLSKTSMKQHLPIPQQTRDTRDRSAFPDFEGGALTFEQHLPMTGTSTDPNDAWLKHELFLSWFWETLHHGYSELKPHEIEAMGDARGWNRAPFTPAEHGTANVVGVLTEVYSLYAHPNQYRQAAAQDFMHQVFANLETWLTSSSEALSSSIESGTYASISLAPDLKAPIWSLYHDLLAHIEQCKFINVTMSYVLTENKKQPCIEHQLLVGKVKALQNECTLLSDNVYRLATSMRDQLRNQLFLQRFDEVVLGNLSEGEDELMIVKELQNLGHQSEMKRVCQDLKNSWVDGLEGILRTKLA